MINWWAIALLLASAQGLLLGITLLLPVKKKDRSNVFLGLIVLVLSLELLNAWGMQVHYHSAKNAIPFWLLESYLILPPSLWFFVQSNRNPGFRFRKKDLLLYVPAFIEITVETILTTRYRLTGQGAHLQEQPLWFFFTEILPILWMAAVLVMYLKALPRFSRQASPAFTPARAHATKLYGLFIIFVLLTVCWMGEAIIRLQIFTITATLLVLFLFALGYLGYAVPAFFDMRVTAPKKPAETPAPAFPGYNDQQELQRLTLIFEQSALHTRPGLTIEALAGELQLPVRYVSYLINSYHATNFHHFINAYRVREVIRKMKDPAEKHKTLLALAFESGFNSKSSFNEVFKSHTGKSPSQYSK